MLEVVVIAVVSFFAALLTFFSGFGLGTLLMPAVAIFFPVEIAVAITALVHLANNLFKVGLVGRHARGEVVVRFGVPALLAAFGGALVLQSLAVSEPLHRYAIGEVEAQVELIEVIVGTLIAIFVAVELSPLQARLALSERWLPLGGLLSGFLGGLSGHQGALRSMFLIKAGLSGKAYLGSGVVIAVMVDVARLLVYGLSVAWVASGVDASLVVIAAVAAFAGSYLCSRYIHKVTIAGIQKLVSLLLLALAAGLIAGVL